MTAVDVKGVCKAFGDRRVLDGIELAVEPGEIFALLGPSGSGKTTLLRIVAGLESADEGSVSFGDGVSGNGIPGRDVGFVMQRPAAFRRTVFENVAYGLRLREVPEEKIDRQVATALDRVGLAAARDAKAWTLSAGEAQRMCFARAAVLEPRVLLLDEVTANLDPTNVALLEAAIRGYNALVGATVLIVTHNPFQARRVGQRAGLLLDGKLIEVSDVRAFFESPKDARTRAFVRGEMPY
ncbi:MAG: ATP-binding cassette domain-containing protein [Methanobacteriota archaeon]|nr:MAG: ATP-binding cassette domain-containing protein [Euryarchaeota archaeon]